MKNIIYIITLSFIASTASFAQTAKMEINEVLNDNTLRSSIELKMTPSSKEVKKAWKNYLEDTYDVDVEGYGFFSKKDILTANASTFRAVSDQKIDLYARIIESENMTKMNVYGSFGYDSFMTPSEHPKEFRAMKSLVGDFVASYLPNYFAEVVDDTRDDVKDAEDNVADLEKKIEKNKEKIMDLNKENIDLTAELAEARIMLSKSKAELNKDKKKLETVKDKVSKNGSGLK